MKKELYVGYHLGSQVFYISLETIHGEIENVTFEKEMSWSSRWRFVNDKFETTIDLTFGCFILIKCTMMMKHVMCVQPYGFLMLKLGIEGVSRHFWIVSTCK
jgi:hypothetical protein